MVIGQGTAHEYSWRKVRFAQ